MHPHTIGEGYRTVSELRQMYRKPIVFSRDSDTERLMQEVQREWVEGVAGP